MKCRDLISYKDPYSKGVNMLTALDHINRLIASEQDLRFFAMKNNKDVLVTELKVHRAELSWLIGELQKNRIEVKEKS
jgi:hypothetical protein